MVDPATLHYGKIIQGKISDGSGWRPGRIVMVIAPDTFGSTLRVPLWRGIELWNDEEYTEGGDRMVNCTFASTNAWEPL